MRYFFILLLLLFPVVTNGQTQDEYERSDALVEQCIERIALDLQAARGTDRYDVLINSCYEGTVYEGIVEFESSDEVDELPEVVSALEFATDGEKVGACTQRIYDQQAADEEIEGGYFQALRNCYMGTSLESYAPDFSEIEAPPKADFSTFKDVFKDERAVLKLQEAYDSIERGLTYEESNNISDCFIDLQNNFDLTNPSSDVQREIANCYRDTSYEPIALVYDQIATRLDCATDKLGKGRLLSIVKNQDHTDREIEIVQKCIIERTAQVSAGVATVNVVAGMGLHNIWMYVLLMMQFPMMLGLRRKTQTWGTVVNSLTNRPLDLSTIRVLQNGSVKRTRVTDGKGRYVFMMPPAAYELEAKKPKFVYPAATLGHTKPLATDAPQGIINLVVPMDPVAKESSAGQLKRKRLRLKTQSSLAYLSVVANVSAIVFVRTPLIISLAVVSTILFILFRLKVIGKKPSHFGTVVDANNKPIKNAVVRIFSKQYNKLADSAICDGKGRYAFLVGAGTYYLTAEKSGFKKLQSPDIIMSESDDGWISDSIQLSS